MGPGASPNAPPIPDEMTPRAALLSALAGIAERTAAAKEAQTKAASDLENAFNQAYERINSKKQAQLANPDEAQSSTEKSSS